MSNRYLSVTVNLEGMSVDRSNHGSDEEKLFAAKAHGRYLQAIGAERLFGLLDELRIKATVFVPGAEAEDNPELVRQIVRCGHEIAALGYAHEDYVGAPGEADLLKRTDGILQDLTGRVVRGWRAPTGILAPATLSALAELGYAYDASNQDDDFPYRLKADGGGAMIELPQQEMLTDKELYERRLPQAKVLKWWREEAFALYREGCYMQLTVTPRADYGSGRTSRIEVLRRFLTEMAEFPDLRIGPCQDALEAIDRGTLFCR